MEPKRSPKQQSAPVVTTAQQSRLLHDQVHRELSSFRASGGLRGFGQLSLHCTPPWVASVFPRHSLHDLSQGSGSEVKSRVSDKGLCYMQLRAAGGRHRLSDTVKGTLSDFG